MSDPTGVQQIFNKHGTGARVGNWVEEEALKGLTGTHRVTAPGDKLLNTNVRTLAHSDRVEPSEWKSAAHEAHDTEKLAHLHASRGAGARAARLERQLAKEAVEEVTRKAPEPPARFDTTSRDTFVRHDDGEYKADGKGRRVMKTLDGTPIPPGARDLDFLASVGVSKRLPKTSAASTMHLTRTLGGTGAGARATLADAPPISVYTQQMATGTFNTTAASGRNPFKRDSKFTNPVMESEKAHAESRDYPVDWVPGTGKSLAAHAASELSIMEVIERFRAKLAERGGTNGIRSLQHTIRRLDATGDGKLDQTELADAIRDMGVDLPARDVLALMNYFDADGSGKVSAEELQRGLAGPMNKRRMALVSEAFRRLDKTGDGVVTIEDLGAAYTPTLAPGESEEDALLEFLGNFESGVEDGRVTAEEFAMYYHGVSAGIPDDDYFELMMRNAWHISGGKGWAANTSCKRVLVRFLDGTEEVVEVKDDLGLRADDVPAIKARLRKQGVKNFVDVKLYE